MSLPRSCVGDPWDPDAQARSGQRALGWFLSSYCVVVVVGNYKFYSWVYEVVCASACTHGNIELLRFHIAIIALDQGPVSHESDC